MVEKLFSEDRDVKCWNVIFIHLHTIADHLDNKKPIIMASTTCFTSRWNNVYLVPSSRVRHLVIIMTFLHKCRSIAEPRSSVTVQFVITLMASSQRIRGLLLFLVPPPILNIMHVSTAVCIRMIWPTYDSRCFFINASSGFVGYISSIIE